MIFTMILSRMKDLVSPALNNQNVWPISILLLKRFLQLWLLWRTCSLQLRHQGVLSAVFYGRRRQSLTQRMQKLHDLLKHLNAKQELEGNNKFAIIWKPAKMFHQPKNRIFMHYTLCLRHSLVEKSKCLGFMVSDGSKSVLIISKSV